MRSFRLVTSYLVSISCIFDKILFSLSKGENLSFFSVPRGTWKNAVGGTPGGHQETFWRKPRIRGFQLSGQKHFDVYSTPFPFCSAPLPPDSLAPCPHHDAQPEDRVSPQTRSNAFARYFPTPPSFMPRSRPFSKPGGLSALSVRHLSLRSHVPPSTHGSPKRPLPRQRSSLRLICRSPHLVRPPSTSVRHPLRLRLSSRTRLTVSPTLPPKRRSSAPACTPPLPRPSPTMR